MMEYNLSQIFPQLQQPLDLQELEISPLELENNQFFINLVQQIIEEYDDRNKNKQNNQHKNKFQLKDIKEFKEIKQILHRIFKKLIPIRVPKGTIIYTLQCEPNQGYFLVFGCVQMLREKNSWEKLQQNDSHTIFKPELRVKYLQEHYNILPKNFHHFQNVFFKQKMIFRYISSSNILSKGYFGFQEMISGSFRTKVAIATEQCILLKMKRKDYQKYLKSFEQKRNNYILYNIFMQTKSQIVEEIQSKFQILFNSSQIKIFNKDQTIYTENQPANSIYYLLNGQVTLSKDIHIEVPKKYLSNENKAQFVKSMKINLHKITKNAYLGDLQIMLSKKARQFTVSANINNTVVIKFDSNLFKRAISESNFYQRQFTMNSKYKYSTSMEVYLRQKNSVIKSYLNQFQQLDQKKKEKNVSILLKNQGHFKQNQLYELFKKQGIFYRDSFERLEGFQQFQEKYDPKRGAINRHKIKSSQNDIQPNKIKIFKKKDEQTEINAIKQEDIDLQTTKRVLMSPNKTSNIFQILNSSSHDKFQLFDFNSEKKSQRNLRKKHRSINQFQQIKKDDEVFKRVLIKNGRYQISRQTNKTNSVKAIVNHKFDEIVKQSMARRDIGIKRALFQNRSDIIKEQFHKTVSNLQQRSSSLSIMTRANATTGFTCKGAEQMRKKLQRFKYEKTTFSAYSKDVKSQQAKLQDCIGFNKKPFSSQIQRNIFSSPRKVNHDRKSPERIILLNHMMKPIVYNSTQL